MSEKEQSNREIRALFIDLDTILADPAEINQRSAEEIRETYIRYRRVRDWEKEEFDQLTDDELQAMESWNQDWVRAIGDLHLPVNLFFYSKTAFSPEHMASMLKFRNIYRGSFVHCPDEESLARTVHAMMADQKDKNRYLVMSRNMLHNIFPEHAIQVKDLGSTDITEIETMCRRVLCTDPKSYFSWYTKENFRHNRDNEIFYKVIFLDIDGVLNDEGDEYKKGVIVDHRMVECLKSIVDRTDAQIIMSSSWRYAYKEFVENGYKSKDKHLNMLQEALDKYGIRISGLTPLSNASGPDARPFEIQEWLRMFDKTFSYVILDDDTFWTWGFLQRNVVTTQTFMPNARRYHQYVRGLTIAHADKAVSILNDEGVLIHKI